MHGYRISQAAALLGVSDDTVRRLVDSGRLPVSIDDAGRKVVPGAALAAYAESQPGMADLGLGNQGSARNRLVGIVTKVTSDTVMSEVQLRCGPFTITSLISTDSVRRLGLEVGRLAVAVIKATTVMLEAEEQPQ